MYMSREELQEYLNTADYNRLNLTVSKNKYEFVYDDRTLYLLYCKFHLFKTNWSFSEITTEIFNRLKQIHMSCTRHKKEMRNLSLSVDYDLVLKEKDKESYYIFRGGLNSIFYNPTETKSVKLSTLSKESIYLAISEYENVDFKTLLTEYCPTSQNVEILKLLSINISAIYTKEDAH